MLNEKRPGSAEIALVSLRWNGEPLAAGVARPGEPVMLGDAEGALAQLPHDALGCASWKIADADGGPHVHIPEGRVASLTGPSGLRLIAGPARVALAASEEAALLFGAFDVTVTACATEPVQRRRGVSAGAWVHTAIVAAMHASVLLFGQRAAFAAQLEAEATPDLEPLRAYLAAAEERSAAQDKVLFDGTGKAEGKRASGEHGNGKEGGGERHEGAEGKAGATTSRGADKHWGATRREQQGAGSPRADELEIARTFGMVGLLQTSEAAALRSEGASPWGADDPFAAAGGMLGRAVGEARGDLGLGLTGIGEGGGGTGEGIGLGSIGTIGHTRGLAGLGTGGAGSPGAIGLGFISTWSHDWGVDRRPPAVWRSRTYACGGDSVSGRLPAETIQRIVRQNFGRFRACYEDGLKRNPSLGGRVGVSFVIGHDGLVSSVADGGSDLPDEKVTACVLRSFYGISFPQPEGGIVSVTYPIVFSKTE